MPNIIEQQDLLKGLTDQRLAALMQQPVGDIPPFLVAAEAQRRQAIRSQFSGDARKNESVVDTLAKQMAGVPQNVNPNPVAPPAPPAQQAGIAGIQQPGMAAGGMVHRYQFGGPVSTYMAYAPMGLSQVGEGINSVYDWVGNTASNVYTYLTTPKSSAEQAVDDVEAEGYKDPFASANGAAEFGGKIVKPRDKNAGKDDTSTENLDAPQKDVLREQLKALYSDDGVDSWDRAQKWFAASQQFFDPNATTAESIANAIGAFGQGMAQEKQAEREASMSEKEALLKYDIDKANEERQSAAETLKARTDIAKSELDNLRRLQADLAGRIRDIQKGIDNASITDVDAARKDQAALQEEINKNNNQISAYQRFIGKTYGFGLLPQVNLQTGQIEYPGN